MVLVVKLNAYISVIPLLCVYAQRKHPYHVAGIASNDELFGGNNVRVWYECVIFSLFTCSLWYFMIGVPCWTVRIYFIHHRGHSLAIKWDNGRHQNLTRGIRSTGSRLCQSIAICCKWSEAEHIHHMIGFRPNILYIYSLIVLLPPQDWCQDWWRQLWRMRSPLKALIRFI